MKLNKIFIYRKERREQNDKKFNVKKQNKLTGKKAWNPPWRKN